MKYYSEILDDFYDTEKELIDAETAAKAQSVLTETEQDFLKQEIEKAELAVQDAYKQVDAAKAQVAELQKKYDEEIEAINLKYNDLVDDIINPANERLMTALTTRDDLLVEYNKKYGAYMRVYKDKEVLDKILGTHSIFNKFLRELGL